jgi:hypothetical protein
MVRTRNVSMSTPAVMPQPICCTCEPPEALPPAMARTHRWEIMWNRHVPAVSAAAVLGHSQRGEHRHEPDGPEQ